MQITKATLKKQLEVEGGETIEVIDVRLQVQLDPEDSYENIRSLLHQRMDRRFNEMFSAELGLMPGRVKEGERWQQLGMFDDHE
jgi:hypothetical protein